MSLDDLLQFLRLKAAPPSESALDRLDAQLGELLDAMQALEDPEVDPAGARSRLEWRAATFSYRATDTVAREAPAALRDEAGSLRSQLESSLLALSQAVAEGGAVGAVRAQRAPLVALRDRVARIKDAHEAAASHKARRGRVLLLVPAALSAVVGAWFGVDRGLRVERVEALTPAGAFEHVGGVMRARPAYRAYFMREFSRYYFGHPSRFSALYFNQPDAPHNRVLEHKVALRSATRRSVRYVSAVEAEVEVEGDARFPWHELTVTPRVSVPAEGRERLRGVVLVSDGVGPALDLAWTVTSSGMTLAQGARPVLHRESQRVIDPENPRVAPREVREGRIDPPLWWRLPRPPASPDPERYRAWTGCEDAPDGWYERVRDPARLRALTRVAYDAPWRLAVRFVSLRGEAGQAHAEGALGRELLFFQRDPSLLEHPPCADAGDRASDAMNSGPELLEALAMRFTDERRAPQPQGVDLLQARLGVDLLDATRGSRLAASASLDGFLNPQGVLSVSLRYNMPGPRRYAVSLRVNGEVVGRYRFEDLAPEHLRFDDEGREEAVARLRRVFGASR
ncbi:MAG: hypothetical protein R3A48_00370 [Polyangiales bacterium]